MSLPVTQNVKPNKNQEPTKRKWNLTGPQLDSTATMRGITGEHSNNLFSLKTSLYCDKNIAWSFNQGNKNHIGAPVSSALEFCSPRRYSDLTSNSKDFEN
jgi:hypothetical protein